MILWGRERVCPGNNNEADFNSWQEESGRVEEPHTDNPGTRLSIRLCPIKTQVNEAFILPTQGT